MAFKKNKEPLGNSSSYNIGSTIPTTKPSSLSQKNEANSSSSGISTENPAAEDLMRLVGRAIEEWAVRHNMQNLPKRILFEQALAILNALHKNNSI